MNFRFLLPAYIFTVTAALFGWWYGVPEETALIAGILAFAYLLAAWWLTGDRGDWWRFAITPLLLALSGMAFTLLVSGQLAIILLLAALLVLVTVYWSYAYRYATRSVAYRPFSLERLSASLDFLTVFFLASSAYGLKIFLDLPLRMTGVWFSLLVCLLVVQWLWISKSDLAKSWRPALVVAVIVIELFFLATFFPIDFRLLGFLSASTYYALMSIAGSANAGTLTKRQLRLTLGIVCLCWLAVLLTGRWL